MIREQENARYQLWLNDVVDDAPLSASILNVLPVFGRPRIFIFYVYSLTPSLTKRVSFRNVIIINIKIIHRVCAIYRFNFENFVFANYLLARDANRPLTLMD